MSMSTWIVALVLALTGLAAGVVYGVYAGRHDRFPTGPVIAAKIAIERGLGLERQWRRAFHEDVRGLSPAPCPGDDPLVILTGGQSNAANSLSDPVDAAPSRRAYMFFRGRCYPLSDPLLGATDGRGSLWTALGHRLAVETGRAVVFVNAAVGATTCADWLEPRSGYFERMRRAVEDAARQGLRPHLILWSQGEADAGRRAPAGVFERELGALVTRLLDELPLASDARLVLYGVSACYGGRSNADLREAQRRVAKSAPRVVEGPDTDRYGARFRYDGCHFNGRGRDAIVEDTVRLIIPLLKPRE